MDMPSPFPGMDPFLERSEIWPDFHDSMIAYIREALQPLLRPQYVALTQDRLFVVQNHRPIRPDISVFETQPFFATASGAETKATEPMEADLATSILELQLDEIRQPYIQIIEPASGNRVITAIEVLSPDNKTPGAGQKSYQQKQQELWASGANLVEIDLWSAGVRIVLGNPDLAVDDLNRRYLVTVNRAEPTRCEFYAIDLSQRLPRVAIPLKPSDKDVTMDLPTIFQCCYDSGPYPQLLYYDKPAPAALNEEEAKLVQQVLKQ
ncbi:MAG: DUF4058 family protein [Planctomycetaceae bacterium]|nr:DUF4058 family protein [Planctomycetaceae bacterium]